MRLDVLISELAPLATNIDATLKRKRKKRVRNQNARRKRWRGVHRSGHLDHMAAPIGGVGGNKEKKTAELELASD